MNDSELRFQVELTKLYGKGMSYQLEVHGKGKMEIRNKEYYRKVSGAVSEKGYIRFSSLRHAFSILNSLDRSIDFKVDKNMKMSYPAEIPSRYFMIPDGTPTKKLEARFSKDYDIKNETLEERKRMLIRLRTAIWHEVMEVTLIAINTLVFKNPEDTSKLGLADAFADKHVRSQENTGSFFPWTGDKIPPPSHLAGKAAVSLPQKPVKEITMSATSRITGYIRDYANRNVLNIKVPAGKTFTWGSETTTNSSQYKYNAQPGRYRIKASLGKQAVDQTVEILPGSKLPTLKAEFKRDQFGELYIIIEYANWIRGKGLEIKIAKISTNSKVKSFNPDKTQGKITWGQGHDFHREGYKVEAYVHGNGDRFLADLLNKGELIKPQKIKLDFGSRWEVESLKERIRIRYRDWHGYFVCMILDLRGKKAGEFRKSEKSGNIEWGGSAHTDAGLYFVKATLDRGVHEIKKVTLLK